MMRGGSSITAADLAAFAALERTLRRTPRDERDLRVFQRFECALPAILSFGDARVEAVQVANISADGAGIHHQTLELRAGQPIGLSFALARPSGIFTFEFHGRIIWARKHTAGIMYAGGAEARHITHDASEAGLGEYATTLDTEAPAASRLVAANHSSPKS
jgi:hypothetical protein